MLCYSVRFSEAVIISFSVPFLLSNIFTWFYSFFASLLLYEECNLGGIWKKKLFFHSTLKKMHLKTQTSFIIIIFFLSQIINIYHDFSISGLIPVSKITIPSGVKSWNKLWLWWHGRTVQMRVLQVVWDKGNEVKQQLGSCCIWQITDDATKAGNMKQGR